MLKGLHRLVRILASLKTAIPLLVVTIAVTIAGSLQPERDFFRSIGYLALLAANGVSLLFITVLHVPMILQRKGRNALIGVVTTHLGILILIAGIIYGGLAGYRESVRVVEGEMTVVPSLPFTIRLDRLEIEEFPRDQVQHIEPSVVPRKRQDSHLSLYRRGTLVQQAIAAPGRPARIEGYTLLPAFNDFGWYFELLIDDPVHGQRVVPVKPWAPPLISLGERRIMAHALMESAVPAANVFTIENDAMTILGQVTRDQSLAVGDHSVTLGAYKRYTGLKVYARPHAPLLWLGTIFMLAGLIWHFVFRHRDRGGA